MRVASLMAITFLLAGCTVKGPHWGANAAYVPSGARVQRGLVRALKDPNTWIPAAGAAVFAIGDLDENVSEWAGRETPIFGSVQDADDWSGRLRNFNRIAGPLTILATDSGRCRTGTIVANKLRGTAVDAGAVALTAVTVEQLKQGVGRKRPNGVNTRSFPSDRAAEASVFGAIGRENVNWIRMPQYARTAAKATFTTATWLSAWGRVEAKAHYPSDVLTGMALGNFFAKFAHETFILQPCDCRISCGASPDGTGVGVSVNLKR